MATPQALTAVIRAARPDFKSAADKAAFAVHAIVSVNGFSLRKVGDGVDEAAAVGAASLPTEEADITGWNAGGGAAEPGGGGQGGQAGEGGQVDSGTYSFLYVPEQGAEAPQCQGQQKAPLLLLKCLRLDDGGGGNGGGGGVAESRGGGGGGVLLVSLADVANGRPPASLELRLDRFVTSAAPGAAGYANLEELVAAVQGGLREALGEGATPPATKARTAAAAAATGQSATGQQQGQQQGRQWEGAEAEAERRERLRELEREREREGRVFPPPGWGPAGISDEDLMPGGLPRPPGGLGGLGGPGGQGGVPLGPRGLGGGMHVGPENPIFADRLRHPRMPGMGPGMGPPGMGGGVPGMRWDPISPEGLQGWSPDDFTREGRASRNEALNDIGRPPPGRGPDWDNMFG